MTRIRSKRSSRVRDRRGQRSSSGFPSFGGSGGGLPRGLGAGGGIVGLIVVAAFFILPQLLGSDDGGTSTDQIGAGASSEPTVCDSELEQIVCGAVDDVIAYWDTAYPATFQGRFPATDTVFFSESVDTACGAASAGLGPFYCPADQLVYFDLGALADLQRRFDASGDLAAQYIVAHEYGHHVQNVTGIGDLVRERQGTNSSRANELSVAQELQADCFAGAWASSVRTRGLFDRPEEIEEALNAAAAVGDDSIMESTGREVEPEQFTHGSAEQRRRWFAVGYDTADPDACRTFDGAMAP